MKKLKATLAFFIPCILFGATATANASPYVVTLEEVGSNVVASGSGDIDLTGLTYSFTGYNVPYMDPSVALIYTGSSTNYLGYTGPGLYGYVGDISGPSSFGSGTVAGASSGSGDPVEFAAYADTILVPAGYVSDDALSDSAIYDGETFAELGVTPGTYVWTWGSDPDQSFTLEIGATPLPATFPLFASGLGAIGLLVWRRKRKTEQFA
jgi:hypothetical protein